MLLLEPWAHLPDGRKEVRAPTRRQLHKRRTDPRPGGWRHQISRPSSGGSMHTRARSYVRTLSLLTYRPAVDPSTECQIRKRRSIRSLLARSLASSNKHVCGALTMITRASERASPSISNWIRANEQGPLLLPQSLSPSHSRR